MDDRPRMGRYGWLVSMAAIVIIHEGMFGT